MDTPNPAGETLLGRGQRHDERRVFDKIGWRTTPALVAVSVVCFLDRANLSLAASGMRADLRVSARQYGVAASLFFATYVAFQIPSNAVLKRVGAPRWLGLLVFLWGCAASLTASVRSVGQLYLLRLALGALEAGTFPGLVYYIALMYPPSRRALPIGHLAAGTILGLCVSAPMGAMLLRLDGCLGIAGWRWLFLVEGIPSMLLGVALPLCLPLSPGSPGFLSAEEQEMLEHCTREKEATDVGDPQDDAPSQWQVILSVVGNGQIWLLLFVSLLASCMRDTLIFWTPLWIRAMVGGSSLNFERVETGGESDANEKSVVVALLSTLPYALAGVSTSLFGWTSVQLKDVKYHIVVLYVAGGALFSLLPVVNQIGTVAGFVALIGGHIGVNGAMGPYFAKLTSCLTHHNMDFGLAWSIAIHNLGGLLGPALAGYIAEAAQSYTLPIVASGGMLVFAGLLMLPLDLFNARFIKHLGGKPTLLTP